MNDTIYKPLTPQLREDIIRSIESNILELRTCDQNAWVNMQTCANHVLRNLISALPDGYPLPLKKWRTGGKVMDAATYLREKARMTKGNSRVYCGIKCSECPLGAQSDKYDMYCGLYEMIYPDKAVEIVEKWSREHPQKTYVQDFFERCPNAEKTLAGCPSACRNSIYFSGLDCPASKKCADCWNEPMED